MTNTTLSINFYSENITTEDKTKFMEAIAHESYDMNISLVNDKITSLDRKLNKKDITQEEIQAIESEKSELIETRTQLEDKKAETLEVYTSVVNEMSLKNEHGFGNSKDAVRTVLRVLATWNNSKLVKYAIIPCFESPRLYKALETIHIDKNVYLPNKAMDYIKNENVSIITCKDAEIADLVYEGIHVTVI